VRKSTAAAVCLCGCVHIKGLMNPKKMKIKNKQNAQQHKYIYFRDLQEHTKATHYTAFPVLFRLNEKVQAEKDTRGRKQSERASESK
jgi:hypothetical protein